MSAEDWHICEWSTESKFGFWSHNIFSIHAAPGCEWPTEIKFGFWRNNIYSIHAATYRIWQLLSWTHHLSAARAWKWKWSNGVEKSETGLFWCISMTNNVKSQNIFVILLIYFVFITIPIKYLCWCCPHSQTNKFLTTCESLPYSGNCKYWCNQQMIAYKNNCLCCYVFPNKLAKLRRRASLVHFAKIYFWWKEHLSLHTHF